MKVALVVPEYRTERGGSGGVAAVADFLVETLSSVEGWEADIFAIRMAKDAPQSRRLARPGTWRGRPVLERRPAPTRPAIFDVGCAGSEIEALRYLPRRILTAELAKYDCLMMVAGSPAIANIGRDVAVPQILQVATLAKVERRYRTTSSSPLRRAHLRLSTLVTHALDLRGIRIPDAIAVENEWMRRVCLQHHARSVTICPPGVDTEVFRPGDEMRLGGHLISVGRLGEHRKDLATLLRAYARARQSGVKERLVLAGRGALNAADLAVMGELGLDSVVDVVSDPSRDQLVDLLQRASLFVMSSREEGLGIALVEAMACGLPVVTTATEGARFVVGTDAVGELVPIGQPGKLGQAITSWMKSPERRAEAGLRARERAVSTFSTERTGRAFRDLVEQVTRTAGAA